MHVFLRKNFFEKSTPYETVTTAMKSTQNLSPGRFWHAEAESEVKNLQIFHPDLEMKENDLQIFFINPFVGFLVIARNPPNEFWRK